MKYAIALIFAFVTTALLAQDPVKRPENIGIGDFDKAMDEQKDRYSRIIW